MHNRSLFCALIALGLSVSSPGFAQGLLSPPGAPAPTMKTLQQVEPRIDLATLPSTATAVLSITQPGSYYASGNIAGAVGKNTIEVLAVGVTIDLNGFNVTGTDTTRSAILGTAFSALTVRNGRVVGGAYAVRGATRLSCADLVVEGGTTLGILGGFDSQVLRCRLSGSGIQLSNRGLVEDCLTTGSAGVFVDVGGIVQRTRVANGGISVTTDAQVLDCTVSAAPIFGILADDRCVISNCNVNGAGRSGILTGDNARLINCAVTAAGTIGPIASDGGFALGIGCVVEKCVASQNAVPGFNAGSSLQARNCIAATNTGAGFLCGGQARLADCTASGNTVLGISAASRSILSGCVVITNQAGGLYVTGAGALVERCLASGNTGGAGIRVDNGSVRECEAKENLGGPGIRVSTGSTVMNNTSSANGLAATPQNGFLIEGGRARVEDNQAYNNTGFGFEVTNTSSTNSVLVISNSAGSNDLGEYSIGAGNAAGPIVSPANVSTNTVPTANFNL